MNLELLEALGSQTSSHTFHTSQATLPSLLPSGKDKDERRLAKSESAWFGSRKYSCKNLQGSEVFLRNR